MRKLNWFGWSIYTIAAVYETDMAAKELKQNLVNEEYLWSAYRAEAQEVEKDKENVLWNLTS
ncbi:hypothetical protein [Streptomyces hebeiensis]